MKRIAFFITLAFLFCLQTEAQVSFGNAQVFNSGWLFLLEDDSAAIRIDYDDSRWRRLDLPHDWSIEGQLSPDLASCTGYLPGGIGWYRKHFQVTDDAARHYIYFEGVYNRSEVYLNGHLLGKRPNGYISFMYDLTPYLKEGDNVLAVRVDHSRSADSRWYTGSGIYRDVWMVSAPDIHFAQWGIGWRATSLTDRRATIAVDVEVEKHVEATGRLEVKAVLLDAEGRQVAQAFGRITDGKVGLFKQTMTLRVNRPKRWDLDTPYLYTLKTELFADDKRLDGSETKVGLRTLEFNPNKGFALNGRWMKVKGVCLHHDAGVLGAVVPPEVWERRLKNIKEYLGANAIRMSHNPQAPIVYDLCDRLGLLVMDEASDEWEFPKRKWIKGWNKGEPGYQGSFDFFEEWIERDVTDMVRRDRNHPSVFLWNIGNEVDYPNDPYSHPILDGTGATINQPMFGGYKPDAPDAMRIGVIAQRLAACVRTVDKSRPVTGALAGVVMSNQTAYPEAVDVVGYNYTENRYDEDHATYPDRVIYGSETGSGIDAWYAVKNKDFIFGQFIWTGTDYLGEAGAWPSRGLGTGLLDFASLPKPRGYHRATLWSEKPVTYVGTYPKRDYLSPDAWDIWNYEPGQEIRVVCYTNAPQARLLLNGKVVGEMKPYDVKSGIIYWDIRYEVGELRAEGCDEAGNVLSSYAVRSSGLPYGLRVTADCDSLTADRRVAHVLIEVVDEQGIPVRLADNEITCRIEGPARLLGLENGNNSDMSEHRDHRQRVWRGCLLAYVQATGEAGDIRIRFTSPLLQKTEVVLRGDTFSK
nr:sugar-binding domain-containing protein [uncultured Bacteroides sp.]